MTKQSASTKRKPLRGIENCRVVEIGIGDFAECTEWKAVNCSHALPFGYCFLCMHPRVDEIAENTRKALATARI
jgi:hypothetical protein